MYQCYEHVSMAAQKRTRSIAGYFSASTKGLSVEKRPRGEETSLWFDLLLACKLSRKVFFFWMLKVIVCSSCRKTHPCDYRIWKFSVGACPRTPLGDKAQGPCQFFARVSNSVALLLKTLMNPLKFINTGYLVCGLCVISKFLLLQVLGVSCTVLDFLRSHSITKKFSLNKLCTTWTLI